ncbi:hypothetical protein HMPREF0293_2203, partial [Corynebacterium glucuronolyticum ATCC 51866]
CHSIIRLCPTPKIVYETVPNVMTLGINNVMRSSVQKVVTHNTNNAKPPVPHQYKPSTNSPLLAHFPVNPHPSLS